MKRLMVILLAIVMLLPLCACGKKSEAAALLDEIMDCYNVATVSGSMCIGGIAGQSDDSTIRNCYNAGVINEGEVATGGVAGHANNNTVFNCYWLEDSCIYDEYATPLTDEEMHYAEGLTVVRNYKSCGSGREGAVALSPNKSKTGRP